MDPSSLYANHLAFFASHRGDVRRNGGFAFVDSGSEDFTCAFAEEAVDARALPARYRALRLLPWSTIDIAQATLAGFEAKNALAYMTLSSSLPAHGSPPPSSLRIQCVESAAEMDAFTAVQTRAFLTPGKSFDGWFAWLNEKNQKNLGVDEQRFYVGFVDDQPVSVILTVTTGDVVGVYGVGTLEANRKQGISTAMLAFAVAEARRASSPESAISLQVARGSDAERLYEKLGFVRLFETTNLVRPASAAPSR